MTIQAQDLINAWVDNVVDEMKTASQLDDLVRQEGDRFCVRSGKPLWGSYWTIRRLTGPLSYKDACAVEDAMDNFLNNYASALALTVINDEDKDNV